MSCHFLIRSATEKDIDRIVAMRLQLQEHLLASNSNVWQMSTKRIAALPMIYKGSIEDQHCHLVVAEDENSGVILGMGSGKKIEHEEYLPNESGRIDDIWVEPKFRQKGLCKKIISELVKFFESNGIDTIVLDYANGNHEAEAVWRSLGFHDVLTISTAKLPEVRLKSRTEMT
jgi:ribosomal protein S18 acetylase RimI-like enzyme